MYMPMTSFWRYKTYLNIREGSPGRGVKQQWGCRERQISAFSLAIFSDPIEMTNEASFIIC